MDYLQTKGRIFNIQRYSIHDGKGIRTILFLKGCALRCRWCCNPESQSYEIETRMIDGKPVLVGEDTTVAQAMATIVLDRAYYRRSGGGLTLSGGECLCQPEFTRDVLRAAKEAGISTTIESMGYAQWQTIVEILPYLDCYLMDIKHMNTEKHKTFTGKSNGLMLQNARKIAESGQTELIIRVPVVPTFNDTPAEIIEIARFANSLPNVKQLHLLPYHRLGQDKYEQLGRDYTLANIMPMELSQIEALRQAAQNVFQGICQIGG
ncbi:MAG: glycyl-radical enzyme activating protein [Faecalibacterium sp.]